MDDSKKEFEFDLEWVTKLALFAVDKGLDLQQSAVLHPLMDVMAEKFDMDKRVVLQRIAANDDAFETFMILVNASVKAAGTNGYDLDQLAGEGVAKN